mmetsp:Transcript_15636/g.46660  ORF Transcript_15636/g.46660 Transcript_15636/m.46660 type:complete len:176 (+) Transcript_15636:84-611(+)|eukprot:CAMPEP_0119269700 /NCGR_PEP_ID=MMETSP1329-20130426/7001_1 /TAXON_ID=114041 /ORGANISM="Genus nov. species nov., Strain RCC1024" /LENGTH=175 /DNA_ID=CAMNT_0007269701 /DNA_START=40 /DNA_END=567 /DNA_ORIENTATION=+
MAAISAEAGAKYEFKAFDRDGLKQFVNGTAALAAFTAGGLYAKLDRTMPDYRGISKAIVVLQTLALHTQICSMLTSAMLMHVIIRLRDDEVSRWQRNHPLLIRLPMYKFSVGVVMYMTAVALIAYRTMLAGGHGDDLEFERYFTLAYGCAGGLTLGATCYILFSESPSTAKSLRG